MAAIEIGDLKTKNFKRAKELADLAEGWIDQLADATLRGEGVKPGDYAETNATIALAQVYATLAVAEALGDLFYK